MPSRVDSPGATGAPRPAGPENPFGVPGANFGFDFEAVELLPYVMEVLGGEMFEEFLGSILEGLLDGFEVSPRGRGTSTSTPALS